MGPEVRLERQLMWNMYTCQSLRMYVVNHSIIALAVLLFCSRETNRTSVHCVTKVLVNLATGSIGTKAHEKCWE